MLLRSRQGHVGCPWWEGRLIWKTRWRRSALLTTMTHEWEWRRLESGAQYRAGAVGHDARAQAASAGRDTRITPTMCWMPAAVPRTLHPGAGRAGLTRCPCSTSVRRCWLWLASTLPKSDPAVRERVPAVVEGSITDLSPVRRRAVRCRALSGRCALSRHRGCTVPAGSGRVAAGNEAGRFPVHRGDESAGCLSLDRAVAKLLHTILPASTGDGYRFHRPWRRADILLSPGGVCRVVGCGGTSSRCGCMAVTVWGHIYRKIISTH